jgi:hypothetical protein
LEQSIKEGSMKMRHTLNQVVICGLTLAVVSCLSNAVAEEQTSPRKEGVVQQQEASKWGEAGKEVKAAAGSVAEATTETAGTAWDTLKTESVEAWEKTRAGSREVFDTVGDKSKEAWHVTREESKNFWEKGKAKIHEVTSPDPPVAPAAPVQPAAAAPPAVDAPPPPPAGQQ